MLWERIHTHKAETLQRRTFFFCLISLMGQCTVCHLQISLTVKSRSVLHLRTNSESSETSDILYPLSCSSSDLSSYLPCSDSVHPCFPFCLTLSYYHAIVNHVVPYPSCSRIMCWLNLMSLRSLLLPNSGTRSHSTPWLWTPPVFKPVVSIDTNQSDYFIIVFTCVSFLTFSFCVSLCLIPFTVFSSFPPLRLILFSPTSSQLRLPTSAPKL